MYYIPYSYNSKKNEIKKIIREGRHIYSTVFIRNRGPACSELGCSEVAVLVFTFPQTQAYFLPVEHHWP